MISFASNEQGLIVPVDTRGHLSIDQPGLSSYDFLSGLKAGMPLSSLIMSPPIMVVVE